MAGIEAVDVYLDTDQRSDPGLMGMFHCPRICKGKWFSFKYAKTWLARAEVLRSPLTSHSTKDT